jgi:hypothetical protein
MTTKGDGFCKECRDKPFGQAYGTAEKCKHQVSLAGMHFCFACALRFGVCRACGVYFTEKESKE